MVQPKEKAENEENHKGKVSGMDAAMAHRERKQLNFSTIVDFSLLKQGIFFVTLRQQAVTKKMSQPFFVVTPKSGDFDVLLSRAYFIRLSNRFTAVGLFCRRFSTAVRPHCGKNERICR